MIVADLPSGELNALRTEIQAAYDAFKTRGLKLDMTRGKPAPEQLDLANGLLALPGNGDYFSNAREDGRNYGGVQGLAEVRALFSRMMGAPADQIVVGENASLSMMHDSIVWALLKGVPGSARHGPRKTTSRFCALFPAMTAISPSVRNSASA